MTQSFVTSHTQRGLNLIKKIQIALLFLLPILLLLLLLLLLPFLCETADTVFTLGRLLVLVQGSCWVLGPALGRSWGVGRGSAAQAFPSVMGGGTPAGVLQWLSPVCPQGVLAQALQAGRGEAAYLTWDFWAEQTAYWIQGIPVTQNRQHDCLDSAFPCFVSARDVMSAVSTVNLYLNFKWEN